MAYNTKAIKTDKDGNPISQYYNPEIDEYEPVQGAGGGNAVILYNEDGTPNNSLSLGEILDKLDQLTGTVIAEQYRQQNEAIRQQNEQQRIDLYNALKDLDVSQYELRLQKLEHDTSVEEFILEEAYGSVISLPSNIVNGQINEISIFGNTEAEGDNVKSTLGAIRLLLRRNLLRNSNELVETDAYLMKSYYLTEDIEEGEIVTISLKGELGEGKQRFGIFNSSDSGSALLANLYPQDRGEDGIYRKTFAWKKYGENSHIRVYQLPLSVSGVTSTIEWIKLEKGTQESTLYVTAKDEEGNILELRSLPNGTKDEINVSERKLIKRIEVKSNITSGTIINFTDMAEGGTYYAWNENGETETGNKGDTLGIDATVLIYQLAEPEIIPVQITGSLQAYENGTMYIDAIIPRIDFYDINGIAVDVPIGTIDTLYKVDKETGYLYSLDISQAEISQDRLSFIHPDLVEGDLVDWDYEPALESTSPGISMKLPTNLKASINSNIKKIGELSDKVDNLNIRMVAAHKNIQDLQNESNEYKEEFNEHKEEFNRYKQIYVPSNIVSRPMRYIAHRGASAIAPENTISAYELAGQLGFWGVEADAIVTKDGVWVAHHDTNVERMTNGSGNIQEMTFAEIQSLKIDAGANVNYYPDQKIPTIEEFLNICIKWELVPIIEVKGNMDIKNAQSFIELIQSKGLIGKVIISSLQLSHLTTIREINKEVFVEYATHFNSSTIDIIKSLGNAMLSLDYRNVNESVARQCGQNNIILSSYTINDYNIAKSFEQLGISQIYTDILC